LNSVYTDIDDFLNANPDPKLTYNVNGIFLDQAFDKVEDEDGVNVLLYYSKIHKYIKDKGAAKRVVLNPGKHPDQPYMDVADVIVTCENTYAGYVATCTPPDWVFTYPASRFWHLIHTTMTITAMRNAIALSKQRNAGWVYVTPDIELLMGQHVDPWNTLPSPTYWRAEHQYVAGIFAPQGPMCLPFLGC
jgi:hypothetical protein